MRISFLIAMVGGLLIAVMAAMQFSPIAGNAATAPIIPQIGAAR